MGKKKKNKQKCEIVQAKVLIDLHPVPTDDESTTLFISKSVSIQRARENSARIAAEIEKIKPQLNEYLERLKNGDDTAVYRIIKLNVSFATFPEVSRTINQWITRNQKQKMEKLANNMPNKENDEFKWLVFFCVESLRVESESITEATRILEKVGIKSKECKTHLSSSRIRAIYYEMRKRHDYDPIILYNEKEKKIVDEEEYEKFLSSAKTLSDHVELKFNVDGQSEIAKIIPERE